MSLKFTDELSLKYFRSVSEAGEFGQVPTFDELQWVLDYRDLDYRDPHNTGIYKKFHSSITAIFLLIHPRNTRIFRMSL